MAVAYDLDATKDWLVCRTCGTQFPTTDRAALATCFVCDDPRQYIPPSGQSFTTLAELRAAGHRNELVPHPSDGRVAFLSSAPKVAIGQRACLLRTPAGNVLWDCVTLLDEETVRLVSGLGGLGAIVISHPHYYSTHVEWARAFGCPVYMAAEDRAWATVDAPEQQVFMGDVETEIEIGGRKTGVRAIKLGGHFPGSLVLLFDGRLFIADTLMTTPAGVGSWKTDALGDAQERPAGTNSFAFMWSIPNLIPLSADEVSRMWGILKKYEFTSTHGAFAGQDIEEPDVKRRVLDSMQIQTRFMGWTEHPFLNESLGS